MSTFTTPVDCSPPGMYRQRKAEPLLSARFEEPAAAREELEAAWRTEGASGAAAIRSGRIVGYLFAAPRDTAVWARTS